MADPYQQIQALSINKNWSLFLDRDGVINKRLMDDYVKTIEEFEFMEGATAAIAQFTTYFGRVFVVTNQQGVGKGLMTTEAVDRVHAHMLQGIAQTRGKVDGVYYCPALAAEDKPCRKPNTGMAIQAQEEYPEVNFEQSIMVGDSPSDMEFGKRLGMFTVFVNQDLQPDANGDVVVRSLLEFAALV